MSRPTLTVVLAGVADPRLQGAACAGMAPLFDAPGPHDDPEWTNARLERCRAICRCCPIKSACAAVVAEMPKNKRSGIWAGHNYGAATA